MAFKNKTTQIDLNVYPVGSEPLKGPKQRNNTGGLHFQEAGPGWQEVLDELSQDEQQGA